MNKKKASSAAKKMDTLKTMLDLGRDYLPQKFYKQAIGMLQVVLNNAQILSSTSPDEVEEARSMCENARRILATPRATSSPATSSQRANRPQRHGSNQSALSDDIQSQFGNLNMGSPRR